MLKISSSKLAGRDEDQYRQLGGDPEQYRDLIPNIVKILRPQLKQHGLSVLTSPQMPNVAQIVDSSQRHSNSYDVCSFSLSLSPRWKSVPEAPRITINAPGKREDVNYNLDANNIAKNILFTCLNPDSGISNEGDAERLREIIEQRRELDRRDAAPNN